MGKLSGSQMEEIKLTQRKRGTGRKEKHKGPKWVLFASPSALSKGERVFTQLSVKGLGKPVGVYVLQGRLVWSSVFPNKKLRFWQEHGDNSRPTGLWSEELDEMAPTLLMRSPSCFIPLSQSSHFSLLPLFCHPGCINGEMGRNHSNYLEN